MTMCQKSQLICKLNSFCLEWDVIIIYLWQSLKIKGKTIYHFSSMPPEIGREGVYEDPRGRNKIDEYMVKNNKICLGLDAARVKHTWN